MISTSHYLFVKVQKEIEKKSLRKFNRVTAFCLNINHFYSRWTEKKVARKKKTGMCLEWPDAFVSKKIETLIIAVCLRWFRRFVVKPKTVAILHSNLLYHKRALFIPYSEINCGITMNLLSHILAFVCVLFYIDTW